jgi:Domain of unknown function (DUF927)
MRGHERDVLSYLDKEHLRFGLDTPNDFWVRVKVIGWEPVPTRFVLPNEIIGRQSGVWFDGKGDLVHYSRKGDFNRWKTEVAALCEGNSYLILALSAAFEVWHENLGKMWRFSARSLRERRAVPSV